MIIKTIDQYEAVKKYMDALGIFRQELAQNQGVPAEIHELVDGSIQTLIKRLQYQIKIFEYSNE